MLPLMMIVLLVAVAVFRSILKVMAITAPNVTFWAFEVGVVAVIVKPPLANVCLGCKNCAWVISSMTSSRIVQRFRRYSEGDVERSRFIISLAPENVNARMRHEYKPPQK